MYIYSLAFTFREYCKISLAPVRVDIMLFECHSSFRALQFNCTRQVWTGSRVTLSESSLHVMLAPVTSLHVTLVLRTARCYVGSGGVSSRCTSFAARRCSLSSRGSARGACRRRARASRSRARMTSRPPRGSGRPPPSAPAAARRSRPDHTRHYIIHVSNYNLKILRNRLHAFACDFVRM